MTNKKSHLSSALFLRVLCFALAPFFLFGNVINKYFVSDDFKVLNRVCLDRTLLIPHFFRPLSDITIYFNYLIGGFNPVVFNSFNLLVHGINAWLVYECCIRIRTASRNLFNPNLSMMAAVLFLTYPFHGEGIIWLLGRGASMSCTFALIALLSILSKVQLKIRILITCAGYFIGMLAYESVIIFPVIAWLLLKLLGASDKEKRRFTGALLITFGLHLLLRVALSGSVAGNYGSSFFTFSPLAYLLNTGKTAARLFFPPTGGMIWLFYLYGILLLVVAAYVIRFIWKNKAGENSAGFKCLLYCLGIACLVPVITSISTRTSESDRMLYFPSVFFCLTLALFIGQIGRTSNMKYKLFFTIVVYNLIFLHVNSWHWKIAGQTTESLVDQLKNKNRKAMMYVADVPDSYRGAFIFRQGFTEAIRLNGLDSASIKVINFLSEAQTFDPVLRAPLPALGRDDQLVYWNKRVFVPFKSSQ